jgi:hypothetical protein
MLQALLTDWFQLKIHREQREGSPFINELPLRFAELQVDILASSYAGGLTTWKCDSHDEK